MKVLTFKSDKVTSKGREKQSLHALTLEEFNAGCEGVPLAKVGLYGCRAIVSGEKENSLYCNAQCIVGSKFKFCIGHAQYFFAGRV